MVTTGIEKVAEGVFKMYLAREIDLNGFDADVLGSRCHTGAWKTEIPRKAGSSEDSIDGRVLYKG